MGGDFPPGAYDDDPADDARDWPVSEAQERLREAREAKDDMDRNLKKLASEIWGPLTEYARTLKWVDTRRRRKR